MILVDLSGSMEEPDFGSKAKLTRLDGAKQVLAKFVAQRSGDRLALTVFADAAYLLMPFSQDQKLFLQLLKETRLRMAGAKTMLGDAIGFAYKHFVAEPKNTLEKPQMQRRVLIVLTDGNDSGSLIPVREAAELAAEEDIRIYPILLGSHDAVGEQAIDEESLRDIATISGGVFYKAGDERALKEISYKIDALEPSVFSISYYQPSQQLFYWFLLAALLVAQCTHLTVGLRQYFLALRSSHVFDSTEVHVEHHDA